MIHDPNVKSVCVQMCNFFVFFLNEQGMISIILLLLLCDNAVVNVWLVLDAETTWFGNIKSVTRKIYIKE